MDGRGFTMTIATAPRRSISPRRRKQIPAGPWVGRRAQIASSRLELFPFASLGLAVADLQ